jgi:hypothetical protein
MAGLTNQDNSVRGTPRSRLGGLCMAAVPFAVAPVHGGPASVSLYQDG